MSHFQVPDGNLFYVRRVRVVLRMRQGRGEGGKNGQKNPGAVAQTGPGHQTRNGDIKMLYSKD